MRINQSVARTSRWKAFKQWLMITPAIDRIEYADVLTGPSGWPDYAGDVVIITREALD